MVCEEKASSWVWENRARGKEKLPKFYCIAIALINLIGTKCFLKQNASKLRVDIADIHSTWLSLNEWVCLHFSSLRHHHHLVILFYLMLRQKNGKCSYLQSIKGNFDGISSHNRIPKLSWFLSFHLDSGANIFMAHKFFFYLNLRREKYFKSST